MTLRKIALCILFIVLIGSLAQVNANSPHRTVSAQEVEITYLPFFSNSRVPLYSTSYYMITIDTSFTYDLGCELGTRDQQEPGTQDSVVVLDFGLPYYSVENGFGTYLFGFGPVGLSEIRIAAESFAEGYYTCTGSDNDSNLVLGLGTNNKPNSLNTVYKLTSHGEHWANMIDYLNQILLDRNMLQQVQAYGASDIELDWNSPTNTKAWLAGYGSQAEAPLLYFGDAAGCPFDAVPGLTCGTANYPEWTMDDVWYVSWGFEPSLPLPLIYLTSGVHAQQWATLSQYAYDNHGARMDITGVFTQWQACEQWHTCDDTDNTPEEAFWQLSNELNENPETAQELDWSTDIRWVLEGEAYPERDQSASTSGNTLPASLTGLMENLTTTLQSRSIETDTEAQISSKLALLEGLAEKMQISGANPAPKDRTITWIAESYADPEFLTGIIPHGEIAGLPYGAEIGTVWQAQTESGYLQIGAGSSPDHPGQGALFIQNISLDKTSIHSTLLVTEELNGRLDIMEATPTSLLLQSESGIGYIFDLETYTLELMD